MRFAFPLLIAAGAAGARSRAGLSPDREQMIKYTAKNPYDRFPDGRPKVDDKMLERVKGLSLEEAWGILLTAKAIVTSSPAGISRFCIRARNWSAARSRRSICRCGRICSTSWRPTRRSTECRSGQNQKVIDLLQLNDVPVIDLMGAAPGHNFGGDNLQAAVWGRTHTGAVIDGTIRDIEGIRSCRARSSSRSRIRRRSPR